MLPRFFVPCDLNSATVELPPAESHHLAHVLRLKIGALVEIFDGQGNSCQATVAQIGRHNVICTLQPPLKSRDLASLRMTVAAALPKGDRQRLMVEKLTELGVDELVPLITSRSVAKPSASAVLRLESFVIAACKQCGRDRLMTIGEPQPWEQRVQADPAIDEEARWLADALGTRRLPDIGADAGRCTILVGPEGGLSPAERQLALDSGWIPVALGDYVLRVETAAIAAAAAVRLLAARESGSHQ